MPCGLRCSLGKDCNIFKIHFDQCTIGFGTSLEYTDSGVEVYVDENFQVSNTEPTCKQGWSIFGQVSMNLIIIVFVLKDLFLNSKKCYKKFAKTVTWNDARQSCQTEEASGDLISITSDAIQKFAESMIPAGFSSWIGASMESGSLGWSDGSQWTGYVPDGSPCCDDVTDGQCGVIVVTAGLGAWWFLPSLDMGLDGYICQYDAV